MIEAVIFDMDGVLVDSMIYWLETDKKFFASRDITLTPDLIEKMLKQMTGRSEKENIEWLIKNFELKDTFDDLHNERKDRIELVYRQLCQLMPGADKLVKKLKKRGLKQAVATGAPVACAEIIVERFGWKDCFDYLISAEHVKNIGKPAPDIYLHTAQRLGVFPQNCLVFEDAENGVISAKAAGMKCIAVLDKRWSVGNFSQADLVVESLVDERIIKYFNQNHL